MSAPKLVKTLPGPTRTQAQALKDAEEMIRAVRARYKPDLEPALVRFFVPTLEDLHRWKIKLDCGCVSEVFTRQDKPPHEHQWRGNTWGTAGQPLYLPAGQMICEHDDDPEPREERVTAWSDQEVADHEADPVDPPDYLQDSPDVWEVIRHDEPYHSARWEVLLECGHSTSVAVQSAEWKPEDGHESPTSERLAEMKAEVKSDRSRRKGAAKLRRQMLVKIERGWPTPDTHEECRTCPHVRQIVSYADLGKVVRPPRKKPDRKSVEDRKRARLKALEAEADALRRELGED